MNYITVCGAIVLRSCPVSQTTTRLILLIFILLFGLRTYVSV
jgi:hypothetical protein